MKKVFVITTRHKAQDDRIYFKETLSLAKKFNIVLIAPDDGEHLKWEGNIEYHPIKRRKGFVGRIISVIETTYITIKEKPDICHIHDIDLLLSFPFLKIFTKAKLIYDCHEAFPEQVLLNYKLPLLVRKLLSKTVDFFEKNLAKLSDFVITADEPTMKTFKKFGIQTETIFNYPRLELFEWIPPNSMINKSRYCLIYHGSMSRDRGLFHMLEAMVYLKKKNINNILLMLVGLKTPYLKEDVKIFVDKNNLGDMIKVIEWIPHREIASILRKCDIGLVPLQPEEKYKKNIPIKLFEYMALGLPVITANLPSVSYYVEKSGCGILYDSTNSKELAEKVEELINNSELISKMGRNGRLAVEQWWNWNKMEKRLWDIYKELGANV